MKYYNWFFIFIIVLILMIFVLVNNTNIPLDDGRQYRVEASRIANQISNDGFESVNLSDYSHIINIEILKDFNKSFFEGQNADYLIKKIDGEYYRFDYVTYSKDYNTNVFRVINISMGLMALLIVCIMIYIKLKILKPFNRLKEMPYELSKGNLTAPLKENKSRFWGRFVWGINMLRENIEQHRKKELSLQKEKKTLILSISHDIKTPLSAIKLYSKALSKNLYKDVERQYEIAEKINNKADEIESFISQIIKASSEDFLNIEVNENEFYLSDLFEHITGYYTEKLLLLHIDFEINEYANVLIKGDLERSIEVIQNIIENAVKYGDGHYIKIISFDEEDCRLITVENSGCTLSNNEIPHVFDSFWRGSNIGNNEGSGLGLYICRQIMNKMNGDVFLHCMDDKIQVTAVFRKV